MQVKSNNNLQLNTIEKAVSYLKASVNKPQHKEYVFIDEFKALFFEGIHGNEHAYRVLLLAQNISKYENLDENSKHILEFCAIFHDIGRIDDAIDDFHGIRSFKKIEEYNFFGINTLNTQVIKYIVENHCVNDKKAFLNISKYNILNFEKALYLLKIFKDADGLDRVRLGNFNKSYLRLDTSHKLIPFSQDLYKKIIDF